MEVILYGGFSLLSAQACFASAPLAERPFQAVPVKSQSYQFVKPETVLARWLDEYCTNFRNFEETLRKSH